MSDTDLQARLAAANRLDNLNDKVNNFREILKTVSSGATKNIQSCNRALEFLMRDDVAPQVSKAVINWFVINQFKDLNNDDCLSTGTYLVDLFAASRNIAFEEEDARVKKEVADIHSARSNNEQAARMLEKINLENTSREVSPDEKAQIYVQIAELWFEEDDAVNAEKFINKAAHIIHLVKA
jgi:COP9 signalosome complex subunit 4